MSVRQFFVACSSFALGIVVVELYNLYYSKKEDCIQQRIKNLEDFSQKQDQLNNELKNRIKNLESPSSRDKELYKDFDQKRNEESTQKYFFGPQPV
jgi:cell division protein FtsL